MDYVAENNAERERLVQLTSGLSDSDLGKKLPNGWTIAAALVHIAFWDRRQMAVLEQWKKDGVKTIEADPTTVNAGVTALAAAIPPKAAVSLAVEAAEDMDGKVAALSAELATEIEKKGHERILRRFLHRRGHLDQIEALLKR